MYCSNARADCHRTVPPEDVAWWRGAAEVSRPLPPLGESLSRCVELCLKLHALPRSLNQSLNPQALRDDELQAEINEIRLWLTLNPLSDPNRIPLLLAFTSTGADIATGIRIDSDNGHVVINVSGSARYLLHFEKVHSGN